LVSKISIPIADHFHVAASGEFWRSQGIGRWWRCSNKASTDSSGESLTVC
jgi:hypothetical protein